MQLISRLKQVFERFVLKKQQGMTVGSTHHRKELMRWRYELLTIVAIYRPPQIFLERGADKRVVVRFGVKMGSMSNASMRPMPGSSLDELYEHFRILAREEFEAAAAAGVPKDISTCTLEIDDLMIVTRFSCFGHPHVQTLRLEFEYLEAPRVAVH